MVRTKHEQNTNKAGAEVIEFLQCFSITIKRFMYAPEDAHWFADERIATQRCRHKKQMPAAKINLHIVHCVFTN